MSDFFKFLTRRIFYKHIAIYGLVVLLVLSLASIFLNYYTGHGEKMKMPDLRGKTIAEIQNIADKNGFELVVRCEQRKVISYQQQNWLIGATNFQFSLRQLQTTAPR